jgi:hypothetical protein
MSAANTRQDTKKPHGCIASVLICKRQAAIFWHAISSHRESGRCYASAKADYLRDDSAVRGANVN